MYRALHAGGVPCWFVHTSLAKKATTLAFPASPVTILRQFTSDSSLMQRAHRQTASDFWKRLATRSITNCKTGNSARRSLRYPPASGSNTAIQITTRPLGETGRGSSALRKQFHESDLILIVTLGNTTP